MGVMDRERIYSSCKRKDVRAEVGTLRTQERTQSIKVCQAQ